MKMKKKYTVRENIQFYFKTVRHLNPKMVMRIVWRVILGVGLALFSVIIPTAVVYVLTQQLGFNTMIVEIGLLSVGLGLLTYALNYVTQMSFIDGVTARVRDLASKLYSKYLTMDYENIVDSKVNYTYMQALDNGIGGNSDGGEAIFQQFVALLTNSVGFIVYGIMISFYSPLIFLAVAASGVLSYLCLNLVRNFREKHRDQWSKIGARSRYLKNQSVDMRNGEDIRLYQMDQWLGEKSDQLCEERITWIKKESRRQLLADIGEIIALLLREGFAYFYLIQRVLDGMTLTEFTLFFSVMSAFTLWMNQIIQAIHLLKVASQGIDDLRNFFDLETDYEWGTQEALTEDIWVEFKDVSYRYPHAEKDTIANLSFKIKAKEKIALVGVNGAGKSTIVKLMCGLLHPTSGSITVNGIDIASFSQEAYMSMIAPVFQESELWAMTMAQNITMSKEVNDLERVEACLAMSGLSEKVAQLPKGLQTQMTRNIHLDGSELSGGQTQKLMLARALYKQGSLLILDEPTAALDALAEQEMYERYDQLVGDKTSVFISHRLSSTRFCDRILFLEYGQIKEEGDHDTLMKLNGEYAKMYDVQSHYYQEEI